MDEHAPYKVYLADVSYFSGKLEAYLRYKGIPFERSEVNDRILVDEVLPSTGLMKIPVVRTSSGAWLKDTTPMLDWFEQRYPEHPITPPDPATAFIAKLAEDYADEWLWRPALYYRWRYADDRQLLGQRIAREILSEWPIPAKLGGWYFAWRQDRLHLHEEGVRPHNEEHVRQTYLTQLDKLQTILTDQPFLLGSHPSVADYGYFASMFRHFGLDPTPARLMRDRAPAVYEWLARMWNANPKHLGDAQQWHGFAHQGWDYLMTELAEVYLPYLEQNALAWAQQQSHLDFECPQARYPQLPVSQYRVWCRQVLQSLWQQLDQSAQQSAAQRLGATTVSLLERHTDISSGLETEFELPLAPLNITLSPWEKLKLRATGTPKDQPLKTQRSAQIKPGR